MKSKFLALCAMFVTCLGLAGGAHGASYARLKLWNGTDCGSSTGCKFVTIDTTNQNSWIVASGQLTFYQESCLYVWPNNNIGCYNPPYGFNANAFTMHWDGIADGHVISAYARLTCPTGGYHFSANKNYTEHNGDVIWLGDLQLNSGCQTQAPAP